MKRMLSGVLFWAVCVSAYAVNMQAVVDKLIDKVDPAINIGVEVVDLTTGESLYQRNRSRAFIPASNMKLFSDAVVLMVLGPDYHFQTQLSTDASMLHDGVLKGSLYLHLPGDPSLAQAHVKKLLSKLNKWGIHRITGDIVLVSSHSILNDHAPGWMIEDLAYSYGAPIAPLVLDENRITVTINPAARAGKMAVVELNDPSKSLSLNNQVKTKRKAKKCRLDFSMDKQNRLTIHGCVGVGQWAARQRIAIRNPFLYAKGVIQQHLQKMKIKVDGKVKLGNAVRSTLLLASHASKPISQLMADTLKPSDNLYADSLYLHAASVLHGAPLTWKQAQPIIKKYLQQQMGISMQDAVLIDGSGLSRYNLLTPRQTVALLRFLYERFQLSYEYIAALPVAGRDGTLQRRLRKPNQKGFVRAKTGSMTGVVSLSGYLYTANEHTLAFAIYINNAPSTHPSVSGRYRYLVDALCNYFLQQKPSAKMKKMVKKRVAFQQKSMQLEQRRKKSAKWRHVESALKKALQGQSVTVIFRGNQIVLKDNGNDMNKIWSVLQQVGKKYPFAVALHGKSLPASNKRIPFLIWVNSKQEQQEVLRIWVLHEVVT